MLHIILGILKFIGILLAAIILLILLIILSALFVPVRYQGRIIKNEEEIRGQVKVTWLLSIISVMAGYDWKKSEQQLVIRLFGIRLEAILKFMKKLFTRKNPGGRPKQAKLKQEKSEPAKENTAKTEPEPEEILLEEDAGTDEAEDKQPENDDLTYAEELMENENLADAEELSESDDLADAEDSEGLLHKFQTICAKIKGIPAKVKNLIQKLITILQKLLDTGRKIRSGAENLQQKAGQLMNRYHEIRGMLEEYEAKEVSGILFREVKNLISHYGPRRAEGCLHFGTGDPAMTGQLTGILYMILPAQAGKVQIQPEFTEAVFEADLTIRGHIRVCHTLRTAWHLFRNRKLKRLIAKIKKLRA